MKILFSIFLFISALLFASVDLDIEKNSKLLDETSKNEKILDNKLKEMAKNITSKREELKSLEVEIKNLDREIKEKSTEFEEKRVELDKKSEEQKALIKRKQKIEKDIIEIFARELSFSMVLNSTEITGFKDLINEELFLSLSKMAKSNIKELQEEHAKVGSEIVALKGEIETINRYVESMKNKKKNLASLMKKERDVVSSYIEQKERYQNRFAKIQNEKKEIMQILENLKIVKKEEERLEIARQKELKDREDKVAIAIPKVDGEKIDVRQIGTSYQNIATTSYKGAKTIAPLDKFSVSKKFGPYFDPVYNMKVFNESITLSTDSSGAKVKSVLDGKVIFAKETPVLNKVVILEHKGDLHTVYANMDKIAPTIKIGSYVKKGYILGRVDKELTFEVTKKNRHVDPLELIAIK